MKKTRQDVVETLNSLLVDLQANPDGWENPTLERYLEAMAAWLDSARLRQTDEVSWELLCDLFEAGRVYE
jgi:hypothetical protein